MPRLILLLPLLLTVLRAQIAPGTDFGVPRTYRQDFDRLLTNGQYPEAEADARAVLARAETVNGPESMEAALALDMLTEVYFYGDRVRDPAADEVAARAIAIKEKLLGPDNPRVAVSLRLMGNLLSARADYPRARQFYERAVRIHRQTAGEDVRQEAHALSALASVLARTGDLGQAKAVLEEALYLRERHFPPETLNTADALTAYAVLLRDMGNFEQARVNFLRAQSIFEKKMGADHVIVTECLNELGALLNLMSKPAEAVPLLERALAIEEKAYAPDHVELAFVLGNLAASRAGLGELKTARMHYERALVIAEAVYGRDHPEVARILSGYAAVLLRLGERGLAREAAIRAEDIGRAQMALNIRTLPERQALLYASRRPRGLDTLMAVALADSAARRDALDAVIRSRALVFDEMAARRRAMSQARDPEAARLTAALLAARERLAQVVMQGPSNFRKVRYAAALDEARLENDLAGRALAERSAAYRGETARDTAGLSQVAAMLRPGDALVSFVRYGGGSASYAAFVQSANRPAPSLVRLGSARRIDSLVSALRNQVQAEAGSGGASPVRSEALYREAGNALRRRVWDPLEPALAGARRVFVTPDYALNLVDFGALPADGGGYLAEHGPVLYYLSAERDLISPPPARTGTGLLALGSPAFDGAAALRAAAQPAILRGDRSSCMNIASMHFDPLPASASEVREIGALWRKSGVGRVFERTGGGANTGTFKAGAPGKKVIHLAAHSFFLEDQCPAADPVLGENPLLLSGIALAGANRRSLAGPRADDGIVTAEEISAMNLEGVEWAVLSGCATGDGKLLPGEGIFGLRRAFRVAGARTVIMSLWQVDDTATKGWMTELYRQHFAGSKTAAESVRAASLARLADRRAHGLSTHPFYWAGFIASGDSR